MLNRLPKVPALKCLLIIAIAVSLKVVCFANINLIWLVFPLIVVSIVLYLKISKIIAYILICCALALCLAERIEHISLSVPDRYIPDFKAQLIGTAVQVMRSDSNSMKVLVEGELDPQISSVMSDIKVLLKIYGDSSEFNQIHAGSLIYSNCKVRLPRPKQFENDFPEKQYLASLGAKFIGSTKTQDLQIRAHSRTLVYWRDYFREKLNHKLTSFFLPQHSGIMSALILGDQSEIDPATRELFSLTGTAHVLSLSGLHIGVIAIIVFIFLGFIYNKVLKFIVFTVIIAVFVFLTGMQAPAVRAAIMSVLFLLGKTLERESDALNILSITVLLNVFFEPEVIYSSGWQMSIASMFGIFLLFTPFNNYFDRIIKSENYLINYIKASLAVSFAAGMAVSPIVAYYFEVYSIISPIANLVVVLLMNGAMIFGFMTIIVSYIFTPYAELYAAVSAIQIDLSLIINKILLEIPLSYIKGSNAFVTSVFVTVLGVYLFSSKSIKAFAFRSISGALILFLILQQFDLDQSEKVQGRQIYLAKQFNAIIIHDSCSSLVYIADKKPHTRPVHDFNFEKRLLSLKDSLTVIVTGNAGINLCDVLKKSRKFRYFEAGITAQSIIERYLTNGEHLCRYDKYEN